MGMSQDPPHVMEKTIADATHLKFSFPGDAEDITTTWGREVAFLIGLMLAGFYLFGLSMISTILVAGFIVVVSSIIYNIYLEQKTTKEES